MILILVSLGLLLMLASVVFLKGSVNVVDILAIITFSLAIIEMTRDLL